jgi:signal peptidase I
MYKTSFSDNIAWMAHVVLHFFTDTRWTRTFHVVK